MRTESITFILFLMLLMLLVMVFDWRCNCECNDPEPAKCVCNCGTAATPPKQDAGADAFVFHTGQPAENVPDAGVPHE